MTQLNLHAKTYYNDPSIHGGDEHYIDFSGDFHDGAILYPNYRGLGFELLTGSMWIQGTPFGGYLHVFVKLKPNDERSEEPGWSGAEMTLSTDISYWVSPPTGPYSQETWQAELTGTEWKVTEVTV